MEFSYRKVSRCWQRLYSSKSKEIRRTSSGSDGITINKFEANAYQQLLQITNDLSSKKYIFAPLQGHFKSKKPSKKKYRLLTVPTVRDRIVQRYLLQIVQPLVFDYINTGVSYCGVRRQVKQRGVRESGHDQKQAIEQIIRHVENGNFWVFESDIQGFFDNIRKRTLYAQLQTLLGHNQYLSQLLRQVIYYRLGNANDIIKNKKYQNCPSKLSLQKGISQGSSLSPLFANIYLATFDREIC
jgi:RNA-directed DNA polymerase